MSVTPAKWNNFLAADVFDFDKLHGYVTRLPVVYRLVLLQREEYKNDWKNASDQIDFPLDLGRFFIQRTKYPKEPYRHSPNCGAKLPPLGVGL